MPDEVTMGRFVRSNWGHSGIIPRREMNRIGRMLSNISVSGGIDAVITPRGIELKGNRRNQAFPALFDIYELTTTTLKIRGFDMKGDANNKLVAIAGVWKDVAAGSETLDSAITISANTFLYVNATRTDAGGTATLESAASMPDGDDDEEPYPLWYIPFASSKITRTGIRDLRHAPHMTAMA